MMDEREARYADALDAAFVKRNGAEFSAPGEWGDEARAAMAVADAERAELRAALLRVRALADAFADDGLPRHGGNIAWHIEEAIANEKGDFPDAADQRIASQRDRAQAAEAKVARVKALRRNYGARAMHAPTPLAQWADIERDLNAALDGDQ